MRSIATSNLIVCFILCITAGVTTATEPDFDSLSRPLKKLLDDRAKNYFKLPSGEIVDRTVEMEYRTAMAKAEKSVNIINGWKVYPPTPEHLAWGISKQDGVVAERPAMWHDLDGNALPDPILFRSNIADAIRIGIEQVITPGEALCSVTWRSYDQYTGPKYTLIYIKGIPDNAADGGVLQQRSALMKSTPRTHTYTTTYGAEKTVSSYILIYPDENTLSGKELLKLLSESTLQMKNWKFKRMSERRNDKLIKVYTWRPEIFEPHSFKMLKDN